METFHGMLLRGKLPEAGAEDWAAVQQVYPTETGATVELGPEALELVAILKRARSMGREAKEAEDKTKGRLLQLMAGATYGLTPDNQCIKATRIERDGYTATVKPSAYWTIRIQPQDGGEDRP